MSSKLARSFEELNVYQRAKELVNQVYVYTRKKPFSSDFGLVDQVRRSSVSIVSNIAEGFERGTRPDFIRFLFIAKGSCGELRAQLEIARDQQYISEADYVGLRTKALDVSGMISNFIARLKISSKTGNKKP